jgi:hypothetical protein
LLVKEAYGIFVPPMGLKTCPNLIGQLEKSRAVGIPEGQKSLQKAIALGVRADAVFTEGAIHIAEEYVALGNGRDGVRGEAREALKSSSSSNL